MTSARRGIEEYFLDRDAAAEVSAGGDGAGGSVDSGPKVDPVISGPKVDPVIKGTACTIRRDTRSFRTPEAARK